MLGGRFIPLELNSNLEQEIGLKKRMNQKDSMIIVTLDLKRP